MSKSKDPHSWRAKLGKGDLTDECRFCLVLKVASSAGIYYKTVAGESLKKMPPCNRQENA